jgi:hypothetical protein
VWSHLWADVTINFRTGFMQICFLLLEHCIWNKDNDSIVLLIHCKRCYYLNIGVAENSLFIPNVTVLNPLTPELNPSAQRCLTRFFTWDFVSWTAHFVNICVKNQQIHQLFIQFINYVWQLLHVSASHCHLQGAFLVPSERCSIEEQWIEYCGWACCAPHATRHNSPIHNIL